MRVLAFRHSFRGTVMEPRESERKRLDLPAVLIAPRLLRITPEVSILAPARFSRAPRARRPDRQ